MYDQPSDRVTLFADHDLEHGVPAVVAGLVGFPAKVGQPDRFTRPTDASITAIPEDEQFVHFVGGVHEIELTGGLAAIAVGEKLYIDPADDTVRKEADVTTDDVPLGIVQEIDTSRTPDVGRVNIDAWQAFLPAA